MYISQFLDYLKLEKKYSENTLKSYSVDLYELQEYCEIENAEFSEITSAFLRNYIKHLSEKSFSERTINRKISAIKSFFKFLLKTDQIAFSPATNLKTLKQFNNVHPPFSESELKKLLDSPIKFFPDDYIGQRDKLIIELLYQTGIRRSELLGLAIQDIDVHNSTIKVIGKRNKQRIVPISSQLIDDIISYLHIRNEAFQTQSDKLFLTKKGIPIYDKLVYNIVNFYLSKVSTKPKKSPHMLRHSFATHTLDRGAELNAIKTILGHSGLSATQVYVHGSIEQLKQVFNQTHPRERSKTRKTMTIKLQTVNFNAKPDLEQYVEKKLSKLDQYYDKIISAQVFMRVEKMSEKENKFVDIKLEVPGDDIIVKKSGQTFEECVDLSIDTLKKLIIRKKEKDSDR